MKRLKLLKTGKNEDVVVPRKKSGKPCKINCMEEIVRGTYR